MTQVPETDAKYQLNFCDFWRRFFIV